LTAACGGHDETLRRAEDEGLKKKVWEEEKESEEE